MKKITFILGGMGRGGAERVISILSNYYAKKGYETDIIVLLDNTVGYELDATTRLIDFTGKTKSRYKRIPFWVKSIKKYVKDEKPDIIISFVARINVIVQYALRKSKVPIIVSERNDPRLDGRGQLTNFMTKRLYPKAKMVVFQTERAKSYFPKLDNATIIPNPIIVNTNSQVRNKNKIVNVGRLAEQKNQKMLITAFSELAKVNDDAFLEIYGEGAMRHSIQDHIDSLGLSERVVLKGNHANVLELISNAGMFCLSSDYEGLSNALLEAMMLGIPCVSTNCAGADEYIVDGDNGYLVEVGDKDAFAKKMISLYSNEDLQEKFSTNSKLTSNKFTLDTVMSAWDKIIEK